MEKWGLFVGNWVDVPKDIPIVTEMVNAYGQTCAFMSITGSQDPRKLRPIILKASLAMISPRIEIEDGGPTEDDC